MDIAIVSASLKEQSNSRVLATLAHEKSKEIGLESDLIDLRDTMLPLCDAGKSFGDPSVSEVGPRLKDAKGILLATPIYNYTVNSAVKTLIEHTGDGWRDKPVGFLVSAGGFGSYMAIMGIANSLMLDFRSIIIPRFVYTTGKNKDENGNFDDETKDRLSELCQTMAKWIEIA